jgi:hypothetical protein
VTVTLMSSSSFPARLKESSRSRNVFFFSRCRATEEPPQAGVVVLAPPFLSSRSSGILPFDIIILILIIIARET